MTPAMVIPLEVQTARVVQETVAVMVTLVIPADQGVLAVLIAAEEVIQAILKVQMVPEVVVVEIIPAGREDLMATGEIVPVDREVQAVRVMVVIKKPV